MKAEVVGEEKGLYREMLDENYHQAEIETVAWGNAEKVYLTTMAQALASKAFKEYIEDSNKHKMTYDLKAYYVALLKRDLKLNGVDFDAVLASYLLTSEDSSRDRKSNV